MVVLYDWDKISRAANGKLDRIITIFDMIVFNRKVRSLSDSRRWVAGKEYSGDSFMLNPEELLQYKNCYTRKEVCRYIALCARRSYADYKIYGTKTLDLVKCPLPLYKLQRNRLLEIKDNKIYFLYEELKD